LLLRGTAESGALKANALPGGAKRLAVRAVKGAQFAFIGAKRETLDQKKRAVQAQVFSRKGRKTGLVSAMRGSVLDGFGK